MNSLRSKPQPKYSGPERRRRPRVEVWAPALCVLLLAGARAARASLTSTNPGRSSWSPGDFPFGSDGADTDSNIPSLGVDTTGYLYTKDSHGHSVFPNLNGEWRLSSHGESWEAMARVQGAIVITEPGTYYVDAPEAFFGITREAAPVQVHFGRRLESWSRLDDTWQLGIWQPLFRWDYLNPETVGLLGFFANVRSSEAQAVLFVSPVFIPERGQSVEFSDGQVTSSSPFVRPPSSQVTLFGVQTQARYQLQMPSIRELILHPSVGLHVRAGKTEGTWIAASYAYQPINQVLLAFDGFLSLQSGTPEAHVQLHPRIFYHHLAAFDLGYSPAPQAPVQGWISMIADQPVKQDTPADWTAQQVARAIVASPTGSWKFTSFEGLPGHVDLSYLRVWGGNAPDVGRDATGTGTYFDPRYPYQSAVRGTLETPLPGRFGSHVQASSRVIYDIGHRGTLFSMELKYRPRESWILSAGADLLGSRANSGSSSTVDFIQANRTNDRVHAGVTHVF